MEHRVDHDEGDNEGPHFLLRFRWHCRGQWNVQWSLWVAGRAQHQQRRGAVWGAGAGAAGDAGEIAMGDVDAETE